MELSAEQCRVVGCLIEKERATPQNYPLTLNALRLACNQSTNRDPVVDYDEQTIERALTSLREMGLTRIIYSTSNRAAKYRQVIDEALRLEDDEIAALGILLLRGPQTQGEIKGRAERLFAFADLGAVQQTLDRLAARDEPLVRRLERRPGQKDARYIHLLGDEQVNEDLWEPAHSEDSHESPPPAAPTSGYVAPAPLYSSAPSARSASPSFIAAPVSSGPTTEDLQFEIELLRDELAALRAQFDIFRSQFN